MGPLAAILFIMGVSLVFLTSAFLRTSGAPSLGSGPFRWPWQVRSWYTPAGYVLYLAGWALWIASAGLQLFK